MDSKIIRIGTRGSQLALWQANTVKLQLESFGHLCEIVIINSHGDTDLQSPLYEMGITGVFTKTLDAALLNGTIDIAVHSMKDVPTKLPEGIVQAAVLKRACSQDVLLYKESLDFLATTAIVATGSLRRKAQWLNRYPNHKIENIRGNVNSRLEKLKSHPSWNAAIFAKAGLNRIGLLTQKYLILDWMIPAPAQGVILVTANTGSSVLRICEKLNDKDTEICTFAERDFLRILEGGCSAPIGANASVCEDKISFRAGIFSPDGKKAFSIERDFLRSEYTQIGDRVAKELLKAGADTILNEIRSLNS